MRWIFQRAYFQYQKILQVPPSTNALVKYFSYFSNWESPKGYDSGIQIFNSATNEKTPLIISKKNTVTWYICGPTVYAESHIGHACCYVRFDIIKRIMENVFNINVLLLMGITDIDDKIIRKSLETGKSVSEIARQYEFEFFEDMAKMQVQLPNAVSRVTENIPSIINFISNLIAKEFAYATIEGNVYFIVSKSSSADIIDETPDVLQTVSDPLKKDKRDFALWKTSKSGEPFWLSPWGKGRPGWHIECSAMASDMFGSKLDIHSGGSDLQFPHHVNEKSQSEAYHDCSQWVNYWLHSGLLQVENDIKMSKSVQNTVSIKEFLKDNCVNDFRILCLQSLYRKNISYCNETITGAKALHNKLHVFINESELYINGKQRISSYLEEELMKKLELTREKVTALLADDFNTSQVLLLLSGLIDDVNIALQSSLSTSSQKAQGVTAIAACSVYVDSILKIFGVDIMSKKRLRREFINLIDDIVQFRSTVRVIALCQTGRDNISAHKLINKAFQDVKISRKPMLKLEEGLQVAQDINSTVDLFYKEAMDFVVNLSNNDRDLETSKNFFDTEKKRRRHLFVLCDNLRSNLQVYGISIKDYKDNSTWFPAISLKLC